MASDRGVSPVIGVILMVAFTVILAAIIGTFVLDFGSEKATDTPQASFSFELSNGDIWITLTGGDALDTDELSVIANGSSVNFTAPGPQLSSGERIVVNGSAVESGQDIAVVWSGENDNSAILARWEVP